MLRRVNYLRSKEHRVPRCDVRLVNFFQYSLPGLTGSADAAERLAEDLNDTWVQRFLAGAYDSAFGFGLFGGQVRDPEVLAERDRAHRAGAASQRGALGALQGLPQQTTIHVEYRPTIEAGVVTQIDSVRRLLEQQAPFLARLIDRRLQQAQVFSARRGGLLE